MVSERCSVVPFLKNTLDMMYSFGDVSQPREDTAELLLERVRGWCRRTVAACVEQRAKERGNKSEEKERGNKSEKKGKKESGEKGKMYEKNERKGRGWKAGVLQLHTRAPGACVVIICASPFFIFHVVHRIL